MGGAVPSIFRQTCLNLSRIIQKCAVKSKYLREQINCVKVQSVAPTSTSITKNQIVLKGDSGASKHFLKEKDEHILQNKAPCHNGPHAMLPNKDILTPSTTGELPIPTVSSEAKLFLPSPTCS